MCCSPGMCVCKHVWIWLVCGREESLQKNNVKMEQFKQERTLPFGLFPNSLPVGARLVGGSLA